MADILLINRDDIMRLTSLDGNVDETKLLPHIKTAQDIHLQPVIGSNLMKKLESIVEDGTMDEAENENYKNLLYIYVTPALVFWTMWNYLPFSQYEIANGGVFQHQSENSATPDDASVKMIIQKMKDNAESYGRRLTGYICDNSTLFPELNETVDGGDDYAEGSDTFHGWVM